MHGVRRQKEGGLCTTICAPSFSFSPYGSARSRAVRADSITYRFQGQVDTTTGMVPPLVGDIVMGTVTFEVPRIDAPPAAVAGIFQTRKDIYQLSFAHEPGAAPFDSRTLHNQLFTGEVHNAFPEDSLSIVLSTFPPFPQLGFTIDLLDLTGTALPTPTCRSRRIWSRSR